MGPEYEVAEDIPELGLREGDRADGEPWRVESQNGMWMVTFVGRKKGGATAGIPYVSISLPLVLVATSSLFREVRG